MKALDDAIELAEEILTDPTDAATRDRAKRLVELLIEVDEKLEDMRYDAMGEDL